MKYAVITGVSKGLGEAIARLLLELGIHVIGISRNKNESLTTLAKQNNVIFQHYYCDLAKLGELEKTIHRINDQIFACKPTSIYLINNAATLDPIAPATKIENSILEHHVQVNTIAPMVFQNSLLKKAIEQNVKFIGVAITSGAAELLSYGWGAYCSSKASLNVYTKVTALEQAELKTGNKIIGFDPGIMDTQMQAKIRASSAEDFIEVDLFRDYKRKDLLQDPITVARILVDILVDEDNLVNGKMYRVKDYG
ncbi:(S)-benzoin forming benzil reductase [Oceanobacillus profundus]|uniref:(S)-benzoin forming benzil reductase n=1 Tax=Oceanobacillus profundus TaxID=372463 RepID=UPI003635E326